MDLAPGELSGVLRVALVPVVAVGDHHSRVIAGLARRELHPPAADPVAVERLAAHDLGLELDLVAKAEMVDVLVQVREHLLAAREVRVVARHRELAVLGRVARADDLGRVVHAVGPVAADVGVALELVIRDLRLGERPGDAVAGVTGADDAVNTRFRSLARSARSRRIRHRRELAPRPQRAGV
jgi:hypothetical protein